MVYPFCDSPRQSFGIALGSGLAGGLGGVALDLSPAAVIAVAAGLALAGELAGHWLAGDFDGLVDGGSGPATGTEAE